jgi:hypothetical protein
MLAAIHLRALGIFGDLGRRRGRVRAMPATSYWRSKAPPIVAVVLHLRSSWVSWALRN